MRGTIIPVSSAILALAALTAGLSTSRPLAAAPTAVGQDPGEAIFKGKGSCFTCHRQDAKGTPLAPDLTDDRWINFEARPTQEQVEALVREGVAQPVQHPAPMPPMGGASLSEEEIAAVAAYVLGLSESAEPDPGVGDQPAV